MADTHDLKSPSSQSSLAITAERLEKLSKHSMSPGMCESYATALQACRIVQRLAEIRVAQYLTGADYEELYQLVELARHLSEKTE